MLAYYIYAHLVLSSWTAIRLFFDGRRRLATVQSGHPLRVISGNPAIASRPRAIVRTAASRRLDAMNDECAATHVRSGDSAGAIADIEASVPPKSGAPAHLHKDHDKIFKVLEGTFRFRCAGDVFDVTPGTTIIVARGVEHSWMNLGLAPGRIAYSFIPCNVDDVFAQIGSRG